MVLLKVLKSCTFLAKNGGVRKAKPGDVIPPVNRAELKRLVGEGLAEPYEKPRMENKIMTHEGTHPIAPGVKVIAPFGEEGGSEIGTVLQVGKKIRVSFPDDVKEYRLFNEDELEVI